VSTGHEGSPPRNGQPTKSKVRWPKLLELKRRGEPIVAITAYDFPTALAAEEAQVDVVLVGDSLANVVQGQSTTLPVTLDEMIYHGRLARRAVKRAMLVLDLPFLSYHVSVEEALRSAGRAMKEAEAEAVKVEGAGRLLPAIKAMVESGIPVMGHLGLTPQSVHALGGFKVQGRDAVTADRIMADARALQDAGVFSVVLECLPETLAEKVTKALEIPTIGIGAGVGCDGQVLVWHDALGLRNSPPPSFVKMFAKLHEAAVTGLKDYAQQVRAREYPNEKYRFE